MKIRIVESDALKDPEVQDTLEKLPDNEEDIVEKILERVNFDPVDNPNDITKALDLALEVAIDALEYGRKTAGAAANVLLVGGAGTGKSSIVNQWAKQRNVNLVAKNASSFDKTDMGGGVAPEVDETGKRKNSMTRLTNTEFDSLQTPGSVLFLDELNRADSEIVGSLLTLILDHKVPDNYSDGGMKFLDGFLFTIAAVNPADEDTYEGTTQFDNALLDRFRQIPVYADVQKYKKHLIAELEDNLKVDEARFNKRKDDRSHRKLIATQGKIKLANTILSSPEFEFDSIDDEREARETEREDKILQNKILSPRGFSALIRACDGTKKDFLDKWNDFCNVNKKDMVEQILTHYTDIDDKANNALRYKDGFLSDDDAENSIFGKETKWDKLSSKL